MFFLKDGKENTDLNFNDIKFYEDSKLKKTIQYLIDDDERLGSILNLIFPKNLNFIMKKIAIKKIKYLLSNINTVEELQEKVLKNILIEKILTNGSITSFTWSGLDKLESSSRYIFISNHRDISLDPVLFQYILLKSGFNTSAIAFGSNLGKNPIVSDIIRCNKGFVVKRDLPPKEQYNSLVNLSAYIKTLLDKNISIWIAQKEGRAKDGNDETNPGILKMLYLAHKKSGLSFIEYINYCKIVPVVISYQYDPCAIFKAKELIAKESGVKYIKRENEDYESILLGLTGHKGKIHISIGAPIKNRGIIAEFIKHDKTVADEIDFFIHKNYKLFSTNYIAYDILYGGVKFKDKYSKIDKDNFLELYANLDNKIYKNILLQYSNPVKNFYK